MAGTMPLFVIFFILIGALIGFGVAAIVLRAAVSVYNKILGARQISAEPLPAYKVPVQRAAPDDGNPYVASLAPTLATSSVGELPNPSFGKAFAIAVVNWILQMTLGFALAIPLNEVPNGRWILGFISLPIGFLIGAVLIHSMLPTRKFSQAVWVQLFHWGIWLIIGGFVMFLVWGINYLAPANNF